MVPWVNIAEILEHQREYDPVRFQNEVLGLPTTLGDHVITRQELEACCQDRSFAESFTDVPFGARAGLVAGIDWGGGSVSGTILVLGYALSNLDFWIVRMDRWVPHADPNTVLEEIAHLCYRFRVPWIAADGGGNGHVYNRLLLDRLHKRNQIPALYAIYYSAADQDPVRDGALTKWTVNRSASIATLFSRIKKRQILFPRVVECGTFLDEFTCVYRVYDEEMKRIRFTKPETFKDDALHATNYAELLALRRLHNVYEDGRT
jgi:hypothetical protein